MAFTFIPYTLGPLENNTFLLVDPDSGQAAVIDPSFDSEIILEDVKQHGWTVTQIWLTHAHFDHIAGCSLIASSADPAIPIALHPGDLVLWRQGGGAPYFGVGFDSGPEPTLSLAHGQVLKLGNASIEVRHTPGHTRGHVLFYCAEAAVAFCGDLIFKGSVGRTDLPGADLDALLNSIKTQVMTLPPRTMLASGHGPATTVAEEADHNPFIR